MKSRRLILVTGKGGVGKTTVASATALLAADRGRPTRLVSVDVAHSLGDVWGRALGHRPKSVAPRLRAQEISPAEEIELSWGAIRAFVARFLTSQGVDEVMADELAVLPGAEELVSLLALERMLGDDGADGDEVVVVDCAPTAATLRLLAFPEAFHRAMERLFPRGKRLARALRPLAEAYLKAPLPDDDVLDTMQLIDTRLGRLQRALRDVRHTSVRLVLTPQQTVLRESQRILSMLHLYGLGVDSVVCNRNVPAPATRNGSGAGSAARVLDLARDVFAPIPVLLSGMRPADVVGRAALRRLGAEIYGNADPARILHRDRPMELRREGADWVLSLRVPVPDGRELSMSRVGDELVVVVGAFKKPLVLPRGLHRRAIIDTELSQGVLRIRFAQGESGR